MSDILCVTNRLLCKEDFLARIEKIARAKPKGLILREKDLDESAYRTLACRVMESCSKYGTTCIVHGFSGVAAQLNCSALHLPLPILRTLSAQDRERFRILGASCHSPDEAMEAEKLGCTYITAGHVFDTDCKKGLPGRGIEFLQTVCQTVSIPVYAIGGIHWENVDEVRRAGANGACVMSSAMLCEDVDQYLRQFNQH